MHITRIGKIARLPKAIRDELNGRLSNGERGTELVVWLNSLPEVQRIIAAQFGGRAVRAQNLSEWKHGGYKDWLQEQEAMELARQLPAEMAGLNGADGEPFSDILATWLTARYAMLAHEFKENGELDWERLRVICRDVSTLRRGDHSAQRLKLDQDKLEQKRNTTEDEMVAQFVRWAKDPAVRELISGQGVSEEERGVEAAGGGEVSQRVNESVGQRRSLSARLTGGRRGGVNRTSCRAQRSSNFVPSGTRDMVQSGKSERIRLNQAKEVFLNPLFMRSHGWNTETGK